MGKNESCEFCLLILYRFFALQICVTQKIYTYVTCYYAFRNRLRLVN